MLNKTLVSLAVSSIVFCSSALALELGELTLESKKDEPLKAEIVLSDTDNLTPSDIVIRLGSESEFNSAGFAPERVLSQLQFKVVNQNNKLVVQLSSRTPLRGDQLRFILAARWPSGQVVREYQTPINQPILIEKTGDDVVQSNKHPSTPAKPASSQTRTTTSQKSLDSAKTLDVKKGNTLWSIADKHKQNNQLTIYQTMMAIQSLNENAFYANNINLMKEGAILRLPTQEQISAFNTISSKQEFERQHAAWLELKRAGKVPKKLAEAQLNTQAESKTEQKSRLDKPDTLTLASESSVLPEAVASSNTGDAALVAKLESELSASKELLDKELREKNELASKFKELNDQQQTLEQLIQLKDAQMAELQRQIISAQQLMQEQKNTVDQLLEADQQRREQEMLEADSISNQIFQNPIILSIASVVMMLLGILIGFLLKRRGSKKIAEKDPIDPEFDLSTGVASAAVATSAVASAIPTEEIDDENYAPSADMEEEDPFAFDFDTDEELDDLDVQMDVEETSDLDDDFDFDIPEEEDELDSLDDEIEALSEDDLVEEEEFPLEPIDDDMEMLTEAEAEVIDEVEMDDGNDLFADDFSEEAEIDVVEEDIVEVGTAEEDIVEKDSAEESFVSNLLNETEMEDEAEMEPTANDSVESVIEEALADTDQELELDEIIDVPEFGEQEAADSEEGSDEEEEFDFFDASGNEVATKLDLARAYMDMGDDEGARVILDDVIGSGDETQVAEANNMLERMSPSE